jgi:hypothetical protein
MKKLLEWAIILPPCALIGATQLGTALAVIIIAVVVACIYMPWGGEKDE